MSPLLFRCQTVETSRNRDWPHSIAEIRERLPALHRLRSKDPVTLLEADRREIAACALNAGATTIITWNVRDFVAAASEIGTKTTS